MVLSTVDQETSLLIRITKVLCEGFLQHKTLSLN